MSLSVSDEVIVAGERSCPFSGDALPASAEPRFVVLRTPLPQREGLAALFLFWCPEDCPVRQKMTFSTCKQSVVEGLKGLGCTVDAVLELHDAEELIVTSITARFGSLPGASSGAVCPGARTDAASSEASSQAVGTGQGREEAAALALRQPTCPSPARPQRADRPT